MPLDLLNRAVKVRYSSRVEVSEGPLTHKLILKVLNLEEFVGFALMRRKKKEIHLLPLASVLAHSNSSI
jgi:hypothetical protein